MCSSSLELWSSVQWITRKQESVTPISSRTSNAIFQDLGWTCLSEFTPGKGELILGRTVDVSESGMSAIVLLEMSIGQPIELDFKLPCGPVNVHAIVKNKNAFRYGLEFVLTDKERMAIKRGCRELAYG
jgi:PilZ domain